MMLHLDSMEHDLANKAVWVTTRFLLLTSELCVVAFGSAFGVREDRVSVSGRWVVVYFFDRTNFICY